MSRTDSPAGTTLTAREMNTIVPCGGNFSLTRAEANHGGQIIEHVFEPPYKMADGEDYAFYQNAMGKVELWQVECVQRGEWRWVQEAKRARAKTPLTIVAVNGTTVG